MSEGLMLLALRLGAYTVGSHRIDTDTEIFATLELQPTKTVTSTP